MQPQPSTIKSEQRSLGALLSDKRQLKVPAYQRNFSWTASEIIDFWDDLQGVIYEARENYFLGSMVFILKSDNSLEVVDGQQRLATISLLLAVIRDGFKRSDDIQRANHIDMHYLCSRELRTMEPFPKLSLNEVDNDTYTKIIEESLSLDKINQLSKDKKVIHSNQLLAKTYIVLYDSLKKGSSEFTNLEYLANLVDIITERISCIQIITNSEDSAYVLFETLNDRGLDLTLSDMLKNYIFSKAGKRIEEVKHKWSEIMTFVGQKYLKTFIRHEWMSRYGHTREKELFKKIKTQIKSNPLAIDYISNLREAAIVYDAIRNPEHDIWEKHSPRCRKLLEEIILLGTVQCYPLILSTYFAKQKDLETILNWIVNLTVRYSIICSKGTGNLETTYAKASAYTRKKDVKLKDIKNILLNIWPTDEEFKISFVQKTLSTPSIIKYLLSKIEIHISEDDSTIPNPDSLTVEHILPKKPDKDWPPNMRKDAFLKEWVNRIGNITLLTEPMNREAQSKRFDLKKPVYSKSTYNISKNICQFSDWNESSILDRQSNLAEIASKVWNI